MAITVKGRREYLPAINPATSALVIIDMQRECCVAWPEAISRLDPALGRSYSVRINEVVVPALTRVIGLFRRYNLPIIYLTLDRDGIVEAIQPDAARLGNGDWWTRRAREFVLSKFSSGAFATSPIDNVLRELGVETVFCCGTDTCGCVDATLAEAYDRAYQTILIEDCCCSSRPELHEAAVAIWAYKGFVRSSEQVVADYPWAGWIDPGLRSDPITGVVE